MAIGAGLFGLLAGCGDATDSSVASERQRVCRGKGSSPPTLPPAAEAAAKAFQAEIARQNWDQALAWCCQSVREAADTHPSDAAFFKTVVPVDKIVALDRFPITATRRGPRGASYTFFVRLVEEKDRPIVSWTWRVEQTDAGWEIAFNTTPMADWITSETARKNALAAEREAALARLASKLEGVRTQLTPLRDRFVLGEPMLFRLELVNGGNAELQYDDQQVAVNASMCITDAAGRPVPYTAGPVQTGGAPQPAGPAQTVVLFDDLDIARQYAIDEPGRYRVQFSGRGLSVGAIDPEIRLRSSKLIMMLGTLPSNMVEIDVTR